MLFHSGLYQSNKYVGIKLLGYEGVSVILIDIVKLPFTEYFQWRRSPTMYIIKLLGTCQSDR